MNNLEEQTKDWKECDRLFNKIVEVKGDCPEKYYKEFMEAKVDYVTKYGMRWNLENKPQ